MQLWCTILRHSFASSIFFVTFLNLAKNLKSLPTYSHSDSCPARGFARRECFNSINFPRKAIYKFYKTSLVPVLSLCGSLGTEQNEKIGGVFFKPILFYKAMIPTSADDKKWYLPAKLGAPLLLRPASLAMAKNLKRLVPFLIRHGC